ncbi:hypothetical protein IFM89_022872 [Coptis chinensis]|uniref:Uncharacterized protein n=1 Tax=Coptis chinensis TaxID=261450 RepID=A0A835HPE4_9MAGN|nr:hypothetical protein IFM89_022872 [Coptis chinensis]
MGNASTFASYHGCEVLVKLSYGGSNILIYKVELEWGPNQLVFIYRHLNNMFSIRPFKYTHLRVEPVHSFGTETTGYQ